MTLIEELQKEVDFYKDKNSDLAELLTTTINTLTKQYAELNRLKSTKRIPVATVRYRSMLKPTVDWIGPPPEDKSLLYIEKK